MEISVQIHAKDSSSVIAQKHSIRVHHWNYVENEIISKNTI